MEFGTKQWMLQTSPKPFLHRRAALKHKRQKQLKFESDFPRKRPGLCYAYVMLSISLCGFIFFSFLPDTCPQYTTCSDCTWHTELDCGWCASTNRCMKGGSYGTLPGSADCSTTDWKSYDGTSCPGIHAICEVRSIRFSTASRFRSDSWYSHVFLCLVDCIYLPAPAYYPTKQPKRLKTCKTSPKNKRSISPAYVE